MAAESDTLLRYIRLISLPKESGEAADATLLERFISARDERAFAALVERHAALVLQVCQRILGNVPDAEDAFQAVFLVLARKAATVRPREALPAWLHGVARRLALKTRCARVRSFREATPLSEAPIDPHADPLTDLSARELLGIIDAEIERLPRGQRLPVILCCLEGRSLEEAARELGWTRGSVKGRLERARSRLHARLLRRGLTLSAALATIELSRNSATSAARSDLIITALRGALAVGEAAGTPSGAAALAAQMLRSMSLNRLKIRLAALLAIGLLTGGAVWYRVATVPFPPDSQLGIAPSAVTMLAAAYDETRIPIDVNGQVLDPQGRPVPEARLYIGFSAHRFASDFRFRPVEYPSRVTTGGDGRFRFVFTKSELDAARLDHSRPAVIAVADGYGPAWLDVKEPASNDVSLKLVTDVPIEGRILDHKRRPVAGARVLVWEIASYAAEALTRLLHEQQCLSQNNAWRGPIPDQPPIALTDTNGRFRLTGIGGERVVTLIVEAPSLPRTFLIIATRPGPITPAPKYVLLPQFEYVAPPPRRIRGIVRDNATGGPIAGVRLCAQSQLQRNLYTAISDETGRYELFVPSVPADWTVEAQPESGRPYFATSADASGKPSGEEIVCDLDLVRGIGLCGRLTDAVTRTPPQKAVVEYRPLYPNPYSARGSHVSSCVVAPDGSYRLAVLPGPGLVCVSASPRDWYTVATVDEQKLAALVKDGIDHELRAVGPLIRTAVGANQQSVVCASQFNAVSFIHPDRTDSPVLDFTLERARPIKGTVSGPDAKPLTGVTAVGLTALPEEVLLEDASFTVNGLSPACTRTVFFSHEKRGLGKTIILRGDETEPLTVKLEPFGTILGRVVDKDGKPVPGLGVNLSAFDNCLFCGGVTDAQGRFSVTHLPGRKVWLGVLPPRRVTRNGKEIEVVVQSGETTNLGDLLLSD
jgi:RNA polymerase sigma factor (sigma-70 family)